MPPRFRNRPVLGRPREQPMFVLAGFPPSISNATRKILETAHRPGCRVIHVPSGERDTNLYSKNYVNQLLEAVAGFTVRKRRNDKNGVVSPASIVLFYVPSEDEDLLLFEFDFWAFPIPLFELSERGLNGKTLRHSTEAIENALRRAMSPNGIVKTEAAAIANRVKTSNERDYVRLPPRNFKVKGLGKLSDLFLQMRRGERKWNEKAAELVSKPYNKETLPRLPEAKTRYAFQDDRNIIFLQPHPTAYHGRTREMDDFDAEAAKQTLRSLYRFGAPLEQGFHHDAQKEHGAKLDREIFECCVEGDVRVRGPHANIYPDDFIRGESKQKV